MKIHLKFNHDAETVLESIDCPFTSDEVTDQINDVINKFMRDDKYDNKGHLAELMHDELDYTVILYLALKYTTETIEKKSIRNILRNILDKDEDI